MAVLSDEQKVYVEDAVDFCNHTIYTADQSVCCPGFVVSQCASFWPSLYKDEK